MQRFVNEYYEHRFSFDIIATVVHCRYSIKKDHNMSIYLAMGLDEFRQQPGYGNHYWALLGEWRAAKLQLEEVKDAELHYRRLLVGATFDAPTEGANVHLFGADKKAAKLTMTHVINRSVDPAAIGQCLAELRKTIGDTADTVVAFKPSLVIGAYKKLTDAQQAILAPAVTSAPGTPQLKFTDEK
jgi:hypothetical protein